MEAFTIARLAFQNHGSRCTLALMLSGLLIGHQPVTSSVACLLHATVITTFSLLASAYHTYFVGSN